MCRKRCQHSTQHPRAVQAGHTLWSGLTVICRKRCLQRWGGRKMPCMLRLRLSTSETCGYGEGGAGDSGKPRRGGVIGSGAKARSSQQPAPPARIISTAPLATHHRPVDAEFVRDGQQQVVLALAPDDGARHRAGRHALRAPHHCAARHARGRVRVGPPYRLLLAGVLC